MRLNIEILVIMIIFGKRYKLINTYVKYYDKKNHCNPNTLKNYFSIQIKQFYLTNDKKLAVYAYNVNIYDSKHICLLNIIRYITLHQNLTPNLNINLSY